MTLEERANAFNQAYEAAKAKYGIGLMPVVKDVDYVQTKQGPTQVTTLGLTVVALNDWQEPSPAPAAEPPAPLESPKDDSAH